jgi:molybdopterin molybdotransferase
MPRQLLEIDDARAEVLERVPLPEPEAVALREAAGRVLAEDVIAPEPVPAFDNSAMDGYALRAEDSAAASPEHPVRLQVRDESRAGRPADASVGEGEAIAISTGAMIPDGADAVIRVEDTRAGDNGAVDLFAATGAGQNIRRAGEDIRAGDTVLRAGTLAGPAELGVLSSAARSEVLCARRPRVGVVLGGDELIGPGDPLWPGAVRDSNAYTVPALAAEAGAEVFSIEHVGDDPGDTRDAIGRGLEADVCVVCGGVSVGEHDHVRAALERLGAGEVFWGVALRPGKPTWFGVTEDGRLAFGLPGNPVSAMVTFILFVRPALLAMLGRDPAALRVPVELTEPYAKTPERAHALRCRLVPGPRSWLATLTAEQGSHVLTSMLGADALAIVPTASEGVAAGERLEAELLPAPTIPA